MKNFLIFTSFCALFSLFFGCERVDVSILEDHSVPMEAHEPVDVEIAFEQNVLPILTARCALSGCHIADGPHGLDFRTYESFLAGGEHGPVFLPGNAEESEIVEEIVEGKMPPPPRDPLPDAELQVIVDWINQQEHQDHVGSVISEAHAHTLKIGFMVAGDRTSYLNGAEMAVAEINANGGLLGNTVELLTYVNTDSKLQDSLSVAEKWIREDEVIALIGPNRSTHAIEVGKIAQRHKIPMVTTTASNPNVTNAGDFVFMASVTDNFQIGIMAQLARETLDMTTAAVITRQSDLYTEGISEFFRLSFHDLGGEIVANEFYEGDMLDFTTALATIAVAKPDALFISGFYQDVARITQQARAIPLQNTDGEPTIFLGSDSWDNERLLTHKDAKLEGSFFPGHFSPDTDDPTAQAFVSSYQAIYHQIPTGGVGVCYDAVKIFFEAVERAQTLDADVIRQHLAETQNYAGATRIGGFNERRHPTKSVAIFEIRNGKKQFLQQINP